MDILSIMTQTMESDSAALHAVMCRAIAKLCEHHPDHQDSAGDTGVIDKVIAAMRYTDEDTQQAVCEALHSIGDQHALNVKRIKSAGGTKSVNGAMARHVNNLGLQEKGQLALFCLGESRAKDKEIVDDLAYLVSEIKADDLGIPPWRGPDLSSPLDAGICVEL